MAEFYEVLKRAVGALPANTGEARRAVYDRARKALIAQLEGFSPPLTPSEITSQRLSLEEAVRKVEGEAARAALGLGSAAAAPRPEPTSPRPPPTPSNGEASPAGAAVESEPPPTTTRGAPASAAAPPPSYPSEPPTPADVNGTHQTIAEPAAPEAEAPDELDLPPAEETDPVGQAPDVPAPEEPSLDTPSWRRYRETASASSAAIASAGNDRDAPVDGSYGEEEEPYLPEVRSSRLPLIAGALAALLVVVGLSALVYSQRDLLFGDSEFEQAAPAAVPQPTETAAVPPKPSLTESPREKSDARIPQSSAAEQASPGTVRAVPTQRVTAPSGAENGAIDEVFKPAPPPKPRTGEPVTVARTDPGAQSPSETASDAVVGGVAQTAILYEEGAEGDAAGKAVQGQVVWRTSTIDGVSAVVADVTIPDNSTAVQLSIKPNTEDGFPASHLVEMQFSGSLSSSIRNVPGLILKSSEQAQGDALIGAAIKVTEGLFWIALSAETKDVERNRTLLESRGWVDIPLMYASGKRAILTLEKGIPGEEAITTAFKQWRPN